MAGIEQPLNIIEIVKAVGPYAVALGTTAFGYLQTKRVAEITREKDIEITQLQQSSIRNAERLKTQHLALTQLQKILSPVYAKAEVILHNYGGLIAEKAEARALKFDFNNLVVDDYISFTVESRKIALAEAIAICQTLQDHKAYELVVQFESAITKALSLVNVSGSSSGLEHFNEVKAARREYGLLYVRIFYTLSNAEERS
ncbi:hypothetical protein K5M76_02965 [Shewanella xiamenensis]|uniref:hypothetical protein n=1 Tax=Shewanella TaxID=22 RepID=UPI00146CC229|nr:MULTISPECIES: hypothetical protein [Shewanella]MCT8859078.1 hypothetical protein [Shewanella xiamenensis]MDN5499122.1 hypothetical protein [Shewanella sp.]MDN5527102.1 hypothetical protein [Shewanella sp.]NMD53436.1 hypothetical protein [Shewanella sp. DNRA4]UWG65228.1 hypothetical protein K5M76_02965 [Shewanella xiamenensis]